MSPTDRREEHSADENTIQKLINSFSTGIVSRLCDVEGRLDKVEEKIPILGEGFPIVQECLEQNKERLDKLENHPQYNLEIFANIGDRLDALEAFTECKNCGIKYHHECGECPLCLTHKKVEDQNKLFALWFKRDVGDIEQKDLPSIKETIEEMKQVRLDNNFAHIKRFEALEAQQKRQLKMIEYLLKQDKTIEGVVRSLQDTVVELIKMFQRGEVIKDYDPHGGGHDTYYTEKWHIFNKFLSQLDSAAPEKESEPSEWVHTLYEGIDESLRQWQDSYIKSITDENDKEWQGKLTALLAESYKEAKFTIDMTRVWNELCKGLEELLTK